MKRLAVLLVVLVMCCVSAPSNGYVLVYSLFGTVQTVDTAANDLDTKFVNGFMILNVNEADGTADESTVILYGREGWRNRVYVAYDDVVDLTPYGDYSTLAVDTEDGITMILTGRVVRSVTGPWRRLAVGSTLTGAMSLESGQLFSLDELLIGAGAMRATLDVWMTRNANTSGASAYDVADSLIGNLETRGYLPLEREDEEPPTEPDPGDEEPPLPT